MGKPKAPTTFMTSLDLSSGSSPLKPKSILIMDKPKASFPLTAHLFEMTWLSINMLGLGFLLNPKTSSPSQLASPLGYHPQKKLPPLAAPWREEQWRQSRGIQKMLPPWWLVQMLAWPERVMVAGEVSRRLVDTVHAAEK